MSYFTFGFGASDASGPALPVSMGFDYPVNQWRQKSFSPSCFIDFVRKYNISSKAIVFGDFDNDQNDELCICTIGGELAIYHVSRILSRSNTASKSVRDKISENWLCAKCPELLGGVVCLAVGNIRNNNQNSLVAITMEGKAFLFDFNPTYLNKLSPNKTNRSSTQKPSNVQPDLLIIPSCKFPVPTNVSACAILKINGVNQLILGTSDRKVLAFVFEMVAGKPELRLTFSWTLKDAVISLCSSYEIYTASGSEEKTTVPILVAGLQGGIYAQISLHSGLSGIEYCGCNYEHEEILLSNSLSNSEGESDDENASNIPLIGGFVSDRFALKLRTKRLVSVEVAGPLKVIEDIPLIVCATFDGSLTLQREGEIEWEIQFDHPIFAVDCVNIRSNDSQQIVACCRDGMTYIIDHHKTVVEFQFPEALSAFASGQVHSGDEVVACFAFVGFSEELSLYANLVLPSLTDGDSVSTLTNDSLDIPNNWSDYEHGMFSKSCFTHPWPKQNLQEYKSFLELKLHRLQESSNI